VSWVVFDVLFPPKCGHEGDPATPVRLRRRRIGRKPRSRSRLRIKRLACTKCIWPVILERWRQAIPALYESESRLVASFGRPR
jgi:hypothetical protein